MQMSIAEILVISIGYPLMYLWRWHILGRVFEDPCKEFGRA